MNSINSKSIECHNCAIFPVCFTTVLSEQELRQMDKVIDSRKVVHEDERLFNAGDTFTGVYVIRSGSFKVFSLTKAGDERIVAFYFPGEIMGFDAAETHQHVYYCQALETSSVCKVSLQRLFELAMNIKSLQQQLFKLLSHEAAKGPFININATAEQRLSKFLLYFSQQLQRRGLAHTKIKLTMSRGDIGNYLGLAMETISRLLKKLEVRGVIKVKYRNIELLDIPALQQVEQGIVTL